METIPTTEQQAALDQVCELHLECVGCPHDNIPVCGQRARMQMRSVLEGIPDPRHPLPSED